MDDKEKQIIPEKEIRRLARKIVNLEGSNIRKRVYNETEIVGKIEAMIKEVVKCYSNQ